MRVCIVYLVFVVCVVTTDLLIAYALKNVERLFLHFGVVSMFSGLKISFLVWVTILSGYTSNSRNRIKEFGPTEYAK